MEPTRRSSRAALSERRVIIEPLMRQFPLGLGFTRYAALRQVRLGKGAGKIDLLVVEAKRRGSREARGKVLGQLILYLAHFRACSSAKVLEAVRSATTYDANQQVGYWNGQPRTETDPTWDEVDHWVRSAGPGAKRPCVRAFVALDEWVDGTDNRRLRLAAELLAARRLPISIVLADGRFVTSVGNGG
jgi:hypothetical protein